MALYLDPDKVQLLARLAERTDRTQQDVLRDALEAELVKHKLVKPPKLRP